MRKAKKKSVHQSTKSTKEAEPFLESGKAGLNMDFGKFTGQTVTVFVNAGGEVGKGFTGVLMGSSDRYIKLLMLPAMPPDCSLGNSCEANKDNAFFCALCPYNRKAALGSMAIIPISNIAAFVHNTISSDSSYYI